MSDEITEEFLDQIQHQLRYTETPLSCLKASLLLREVRRLRKAIDSFGNNPAGFDWAVLEKIDQLERENKTLRLRAKKYREDVETLLSETNR